MEQAQLIKFVEEVHQQCRFGKMAWQGLRSALNGMDNERAFFHIHAFLDRARMVSRFLWTDNESSQNRSRSLREILKVSDSSPLNASGLKTFADSTDADFEKWLFSLGHSRYIGANIMPKGTMSDFAQDAFLRSLDPEMYHFTWYDRGLDLRGIFDALRGIESAAEAWIKRQ